MTKVKSLFLGSAAAILAVTGAQAADPPLETFDYVRICDAYGTNYYFIPGTETCLRIGGYTQWRATYHHNDQRDRGFEESIDYNTTDFDFLGRARIWFDAREETEWGTLRAYYEGEANGNGSLNTRFAFLQIAGITAGQAGTPMSFGIGGGPNYGTIAGDNGTSRGEMIYYTQPFGNGFSITVGAQESDTFDSGPGIRGIDFAGNIATTGVVTVGGDDAPDFVANMRFDDPGGLFSVGVAGTVRSVQSHCQNLFVTNSVGGQIGVCPAWGDEESEVGFAVRAGARVNLDFLGNGGSVGVLGTYSDGANNFAADYAPDAILTRTSANPTDTDLETVESWAVYGSAEIGLTPTLNMGIWGGYTEADVDDIWGHVIYTGGLAGTGNTIRQTESWWNVGLSFTWSPINNLDIGLDVIYDHEEDQVLQEDFRGVNSVAEFDDSEDIWTVIVGATRTF